MGVDSFLGQGSQDRGSVHQCPGGNHFGEAGVSGIFPAKAVSGSCRWFWEWETIGKKKIPWKFARPDGDEFCMAGLWEAWNSPEGILETFTIITTSPNELVRSVHDRMPVILSPDEGEVWLEAGRQDLLRSAPDDFLVKTAEPNQVTEGLSLIHISEPTRPY